MRPKAVGILWVVVLLGWGWFPVRAQDTDAVTRRIRGGVIAQRARENAPYSSATQGEMVIRRGRQGRDRLPMESWTLVAPQVTTWTNYFAAQRAAGVERWRIIREPEGNRYERLEVDDASETVSATSVAAATAFAASDFLLGDLGFEFLYYDEHVLVGEQVRKTRNCYILDCLNSDPDDPYGRVKVWIEKETLLPLRAEAYDPGGKKWKVFSIGGLKKEEGAWRVTELEMENYRDNSSTRILLD